MLKVYYRNDINQICTIRPTPLVQISESILKNKEGNFGVTDSKRRNTVRIKSSYK
jgi:hypothetical protein